MPIDGLTDAVTVRISLPARNAPHIAIDQIWRRKSGRSCVGRGQGWLYIIHSLQSGICFVKNVTLNNEFIWHDQHWTLQGKAADGIHPVGRTQEAEQRRGKHLPILLSQPEQQDTVQRVNQAYAPGNSPMRMDQHTPTFPLWHRNVSPDCVKCFKERLGPVKDPYIGHIITH